MKSISLKLDEPVFIETEKILESLHRPRNRYINDALAYYNRINRRKLLAKALAAESELVANDSLCILREFEEIEYENQNL